MFKRHRPRTRLRELREAFWPSMGWTRTFKYARHRLIRLDDTNRKIAGGLALGAALSFSPLIGTHLIQAALIGAVMRVTVIAALIGTALGNPWTFPFMWWAGYSLGAWLFGLIGWEAEALSPDLEGLSALWALVKEEPLTVFLPWMLGGTLIGVAIWFPAYYFYYWLIKGARAARQKVRLRKMKKIAHDITEL